MHSIHLYFFQDSIPHNNNSKPGRRGKLQLQFSLQTSDKSGDDGDDLVASNGHSRIASTSTSKVPTNYSDNEDEASPPTSPSLTFGVEPSK